MSGASAEQPWAHCGLHYLGKTPGQTPLVMMEMTPSHPLCGRHFTRTVPPSRNPHHPVTVTILTLQMRTRL